MILAGDVGGTKTALALFDMQGVNFTLVHEDLLPSRDFPTFEAAVAQFLGSGPTGPIDAASFGIAGAVVEGRAAATNLPWKIDERALEKAIPAKRVRLLNDLEATGHGLAALPPASVVTLQAGKPRTGNIALIAAGTGLGEALLIWDGRNHQVVASEGGHCDFAPRTDEEIELLRFLQKDFGRVSYERILSGPGFFNVYRFLRDTGRYPEPPWLAERLKGARDPNEVLGPVAREGRDPLGAATLDLFTSIYGAEAGNLALKVLAVGGVFIGGGIGPRFRTKLEDGTFVATFRDKGRFTPLLEAMPVHLVLEPRTALLGAARVAQSLV
ncbi:MAG: glucokinase [Candidatus Rokuibacteriota bacterium]